MKVTIEYWPDDPRVSRIRGMRISPFGPLALLVIIFPTVGAAVIIGGLFYGQSRARLFRNGELAFATVTECRAYRAKGRTGPWYSLDEFRKRFLSGEGWDFRQDMSPLVPLIVSVWLIGVWFMLIAGTLFLLVMLASVLTGWPFDVTIQENERMTWAALVAGFLVLWLVVVGVMIRVGTRAWRRARGLPTKGSSADLIQVECKFEFDDHRGNRVSARDTIRFSERIGDEATEPVLFDPNNPKRALLIHGLPLSVGISPSGEWEVQGGVKPMLLAAGFIALWIAGPLIGYYLSQAFG